MEAYYYLCEASEAGDKQVKARTRLNVMEKGLSISLIDNLETILNMTVQIKQLDVRTILTLTPKVSRHFELYLLFS